MLRSGIKEASGRCVLREEEEESVLMKGRYYVSSGRHYYKLSGFPGGTVVKNLPASAGDTGLSPGPGRSQVPRNN